MGAYLAECIESVLGGSYSHFEYIIVNNRSTDQSLDIALKYAKADSRVRVHTNDEFVGVIENHNTAFRMISPAARYCKVVSADDFLFPECIAQLVELAEANPSVGIVGSYQLSGVSVKWQGFRYPHAVIPGSELCRQIFVGGDPNFGFGTPTSLLYRSDVVRRTSEFYPNPSPHSDTSACFRALRDTDFGFVYQVLSYERTHEATQSSASANLNRYVSAYLDDVLQYGPWYLTDQEMEHKLKETVAEYYRFLAVNLLRSRDRSFWDYHRGRLAELGQPPRRPRLLKALVMKSLQEIMNPEQAFRRVRQLVVPANPTNDVR